MLCRDMPEGTSRKYVPGWSALPLPSVEALRRRAYLWKPVDWRYSWIEAAPVLMLGKNDSGPSDSLSTQSMSPRRKYPGFLCDVGGHLVPMMTSSTKEMLVILPVPGNLWGAPMVLWIPAPRAECPSCPTWGGECAALCSAAILVLLAVGW